MFRGLGEKLKRGSQEISQRLNEIPVSDLSSFQAYIQGKDHPDLYLEDIHLHVKLAQLSSVHTTLMNLNQSFTSYRTALRMQSQSEVEIGELVSSIGVQSNSKYESVIGEEFIAKQIAFGALCVVNSNESVSYCEEIGKSIEMLLNQFEIKYKSSILDMKKKYVVIKMEYLKMKKLSQEKQTVEAENEVKRLREEWNVLSSAIQIEAEELLNEIVKGYSAFLAEYTEIRAQFYTRLQGNFNNQHQS